MRKKVFWLIAIALWMVIIFWFSAQPADESSNMSDGISYQIVLQADRILHLDMTTTQMENYAERIHYPIRKAAHMTEYAILAILVWKYLGTTVYLKRNRVRGVISELFVIAYASTDEFHQLFVSGRSGECKDVCIDAVGALIALLIAEIITGILEKREKIGRDRLCKKR